MLPLREGAVDLLFSNLCLQSCRDLPAVLDEFRRAHEGGQIAAFDISKLRGSRVRRET